MKQKIKHWRRVNPYVCKKCGCKRFSFIYPRAVNKVCGRCRRIIKLGINQLSLFDLTK